MPVEGREADGLVEVRASRIRIDEDIDVPFLVLEDARDRQLSVAIGGHEATSIAFALQGVDVPRPMTHDALKQTIEALGAEVLRVVVGFLASSNTFTAEVVLGVAGAERHLDWRLSDAVAVAVRCEPPPPILVPERLMAAPPPSLLEP